MGASHNGGSDMTGINPISQQIVELAKRPEGVRSADFPEMRTKDFSARACKLMNAGTLFRVTHGYKKVRFYATMAQAEAAQAEVVQKPQPTVTMADKSKANWSKDAETVITSDTKITICPGWKPRFQAVDLPHVHTANQRGRVPA